jgi:hypothetical protein
MSNNKTKIFPWTSVVNTPTTLSGYGIINDVTDIDSNQTITGVKTFSASPFVPSPTQSNHAATKGYVDAVSEGLRIHESVHVILTQSLETITGGSVTYDNANFGVGASLTCSNPFVNLGGDSDITTGSRLVVAGQSNAAHNGIYTYTSSTRLTRATDFDSPGEMTGGDFIFVTHGTQYANTGWVLSEAVTAVGTSPVIFLQFSGTGTYIAGYGLNRVGAEFSVNGIDGQIAVNANGVGLATSGVNIGTYKSVTVDTYGRVVAASNPTTLLGYGITDATSTSTFTGHTGDATVHLTSSQNALLDGINYTTITADKINYLSTVSSNIQTQLDDKISTSTFTGHTGDATVHLTSSQNALLDGITVTADKINYLSTVSSNIQTQLDGKSSTSHDHDVATTSVAGFMTATQVTKLNGIASGAQVNVKPNWTATSGDAQILNKPATLNIDQTGTARILILSDNTQYIRCKNTSSTTITVPAESSVTWPADAIIFFRRDTGAGPISLIAPVGVTINGQAIALTIDQGYNFGLKKVGTNVWDVI